MNSDSNRVVVNLHELAAKLSFLVGKLVVFNERQTIGGDVVGIGARRNSPHPIHSRTETCVKVVKLDSIGVSHPSSATTNSLASVKLFHGQNFIKLDHLEECRNVMVVVGDGELVPLFDVLESREVYF